MKSIYYLPLRFTPHSKWACLREISGHDVLAINDAGTLDAIHLLDRLLVARPEVDVSPGMAETIATADRDELLTGVYRNTFGNRIESTINCQACEEAFDLSFQIDQLLAHIRNETGAVEVEREKDGTFRLPDGSSFRLPRGEDERMLFGLPPQQASQLLLERCIVEGENATNGEEVLRSMEKIAAVFETELQANCPECGHQQAVRFDLQSYLLNALLLEKAQLPLEVHRLAMAYGWSQQEILELPRSLRRNYVSMILTELN